MPSVGSEVYNNWNSHTLLIRMYYNGHKTRMQFVKKVQHTATMPPSTSALRNPGEMKEYVHTKTAQECP